MPRKTKEQNGLETKKTTKTTKNEPKSITKNTKSKTTKKSTSASTTKATKKVASNSTTKKTTSKIATKSKSQVAKKTSKATSAKAKTTSKKKTTKAVTKKTTATKKRKVEVVEYYDLPYRYNQTVVKLLAQTPTTLFVYWDISDKDRKAFEKQYGENFFETTKPILIIYNDTLGYSFEVEINDFANSWYLHVADSKCDYRIELGRRPIVKTEKLQPSDFIYVTTSNEMKSPNNKILLDKNQKMVYFRNVKTGQTTEKPITTLSFMQNMGKVYDIYDLYKTIYKNENVEDIYDLTNPSSHSSS